MDEISNMLRHRVASDVAASLDYRCDILGNVIGPVLKCVEGYDASRVVELPRQKIFDDSFQIGPLSLGLAKDAAVVKAINDQIDLLICTVWHGARRPLRSLYASHFAGAWRRPRGQGIDAMAHYLVTQSPGLS